MGITVGALGVEGTAVEEGTVSSVIGSGIVGGGTVGRRVGERGVGGALDVGLAGSSIQSGKERACTDYEF